MNTRRAFASVFAALAVLFGFAEPGAAQTYPEKSIRIITINAAGGPADLAARLLGDRLSASFRQPVVVESMGVQLAILPLPMSRGRPRTDTRC